MSAPDTLTVRGPYTDGSWAVVQQVGDRATGRGFFRSRGLAEAELFRLRDERRGNR